PTTPSKPTTSPTLLSSVPDFPTVRSPSGPESSSRTCPPAQPLLLQPASITEESRELRRMPQPLSSSVSQDPLPELNSSQSSRFLLTFWAESRKSSGPRVPRSSPRPLLLLRVSMLRPTTSPTPTLVSSMLPSVDQRTSW